MQVIVFLLFGSMLAGMLYEKFDRKAKITLVIMIAMGIFAYLYIKRVL